MEKKKRKLLKIGVLAYLTLEDLFDHIFMYLSENMKSDDDYKKIAEYMWTLGDYDNWKLENAYFKVAAESIKVHYPKSYKKLMDFIKEFETEDCEDGNVGGEIAL